MRNLLLTIGTIFSIALIIAAGCGGSGQNGSNSNGTTSTSSTSTGLTGSTSTGSTSTGTSAVVDYRFNNSLLDSSGNGNNGTAVGSMDYVSSPDGFAAYFANNELYAASNYIIIPASASVLALEQSSLTFAIKYKCTDTSQNGGRLFGTAPSAARLAYDYNAAICAEAYAAVGDTSGESFSDESQAGSNPAAKTTTGAWLWGIGVLDRENKIFRLYVNNIQVATTTFPSLGTVPLTHLLIGSVSDSSGGGTGSSANATSVERFLLLNRALTQSEINNLVNNNIVP